MTVTGIESKLRAARRSCTIDSIVRREKGSVHLNATYFGVRINFKTNDGGVECRNFGDIVILALTLLFLELEGDTTDGALLDTLHQVSREAGNLVPEALRGDNSLAIQSSVRRAEHILPDIVTHDFIDNALVGVEVKREARVARTGPG